MSIITGHRNLNLTTKEKERLSLLLGEARSRGLDVAKGIDIVTSYKWPIDSRGYFTKIDGSQYIPTEDQGKFIASPARFSAFFGSRGCVSPDTLIGGVPIENMKNDWGEVSTIFGDQESSPSWLKGRDHLYHIRVGNERGVKATLSHRLLTPNGWEKLGNLSSEDLIFLDGTWRDSLASEKLLDLQGCYSLNFHLNGVLYNLLEVVFLNILLQLHKTVVCNNALVLYNLLSIVDFYALMLSRCVLAHLVSLISYELLQVCIQKIFQSLYSFLQSDNGKVFLHRRSEISLVFPFQFLSQTDKVFDLRCLDYNQQDLLSLRYFVGSLHDPLLPYIRDVTPEIVHSLSLEGLGWLLHEYPIPHKFSLPSCSKYQTLSRQELDFESLCIVDRLTSSFGLNSFVSSDLYSLHKLPYYSAFFGNLQDVFYYKHGEYWDMEVPFGENYSAGGIYHHNSGKSAAGAQKALKKIMQGESGMACNPDLENFKLSTWPEFREWIPWEMVVPAHKYRMNPEWQPQQPFKLVFTNKVEVYCKGIKDPDSARGPNINWLWYDEGGRDLEGLSWQIAVASVRVGDNPQAWTTTTPKGVYHWAHEFFVKQEIPDDVLEVLEKIDMGDTELIEYFHGTIKENEKNLDPLFYASILLAYPKGWLRKQEVEGLFVTEGGALGDRTWFDGKILLKIPDDVVIKARVRYWDLAASEKKLTGKKKNDPDKTVGTLMCWDGKDFYIEDQTSGYWEWKELKENIYRTALEDGIHIPIYIEQEPAAGGKNQVAELKSYIKDKVPVFKIEGHLPKSAGDKVMRAQTWFAEAAAGLIYLICGDWNEPFLGEVDNFPEAKHDDHVDSVSGARHTVAPVRTWKRISFMSLNTIMKDK